MGGVHIIVNRGDWLGSPANIKGTNKDAKIYVGRSTTLHNLLFYTHTLCMSYVTNTFLLVSSLVRSKQLLCFVQGQDQKSEQKHTTKNFDEFHNHFPLLTMIITTEMMTILNNWRANLRRNHQAYNGGHLRSYILTILSSAARHDRFPIL